MHVLGWRWWCKSGRRFGTASACIRIRSSHCATFDIQQPGTANSPLDQLWAAAGELVPWYELPSPGASLEILRSNQEPEYSRKLRGMHPAVVGNTLICGQIKVWYYFNLVLSKSIIIESCRSVYMRANTTHYDTSEPTVKQLQIMAEFHSFERWSNV